MDIEKGGTQTADVLRFEVNYHWEPFTVDNRHLTFQEHCDSRLSQDKCSHWGAAVYKWHGLLTRGEYAGKMGVLIGETEDLRQRIKQYISGTQRTGNKFWRKQFLEMGDIRLYILRLEERPNGAPAKGVLPTRQDLASNNLRKALEQLLIMSEVRQDGPWIVNRTL